MPTTVLGHSELKYPELSRGFIIFGIMRQRSWILGDSQDGQNLQVLEKLRALQKFSTWSLSRESWIILDAKFIIIGCNMRVYKYIYCILSVRTRYIYELIFGLRWLDSSLYRKLNSLLGKLPFILYKESRETLHDMELHIHSTGNGTEIWFVSRMFHNKYIKNDRLS